MERSFYSKIDEITVREATIEDAAEIARIHVKTWQSAYRGQIPDDYLSTLNVDKRTAFWKTRIAENNDKTNQLVAVIEGQIVGFCDIGRTKEETNGGELYSMYVDSDFLDQGIGTELMTEALKRLQDFGFKKAYLWVLNTNTRGQHFYERFGWKLDGTTKIEEKRGAILHELRMIKNF